jgi:hypothetical protein
MPIITLISDWGLSDHYVASVKGAILRRTPGVNIVDISHDIRHFDIKHASFVLRNSFRQFPEGTIHIIGIDSIESKAHQHLVVFAEGHYFIGADNGIFSLILESPPQKIISINVLQDTGYFTFPSRDRFAKVACHIAEGRDIEELGSPVPALVPKSLYQPVTEGNNILGRVMYIDAYENVFVNINEKLFRDTVQNRPFSINFRRDSYAINVLVKAYGDVPEGEMCALFSSNGLLQIAINQGKAASLLGLTIDYPVNVTVKG